MTVSRSKEHPMKWRRNVWQALLSGVRGSRGCALRGGSCAGAAGRAV